MPLEFPSPFSVWIGYEPREADAFLVARHSIRARLSQLVPVRGLLLDRLRGYGWYWRPTETRGGKLFDVISEHPMATEFAISRFLVANLHTATFGHGGWALFLDCDMMARTDLMEVFALADPSYAVMCVKHDHAPKNGLKMDGQVQSQYARKNWSSFCLWNVDHPSNRQLTLDLINTVPGRDLHRFCWLRDNEIGELPPEWNFLVGTSDPAIDPKVVHFTEGIPSMPGYATVAYADEWRRELEAAVI